LIARLFREEREVYLLGLLRVVFGGLLLAYTLKRGQDLWLRGYFGDVFHLPVWPEAWVPSRPLYTALLGLQATCAVLAVVGVRSRGALLAGAGCGLFLLLCDRLQYHNNRYELLLVTILVSLTPCDRSFRWRRPARPGPGPRWAARMVGAQLSIAYLASSVGKLLDPEWRGGSVLHLRFSHGPHIDQHLLPSLVEQLIAQPWFSWVASVAAITSELFLALGLWFPRTRVAALWLGVMFHVGIELSARVELFSYTMLFGYLVFVTPELRERTLSFSASHPRGAPLSGLFRRLDFFARFRHESHAAGDLMRVADRRGRLHHGLGALRELARAIPLLFPLWAPLALFSLGRRNPPPPVPGD
jgi:Vitamin K-dependent gamma-carboxylase